jgi:hypothetical protein
MLDLVQQKLLLLHHLRNMLCFLKLNFVNLFHLEYLVEMVHKPVFQMLLLHHLHRQIFLLLLLYHHLDFLEVDLLVDYFLFHLQLVQNCPMLLILHLNLHYFLLYFQGYLV